MLLCFRIAASARALRRPKLPCQSREVERTAYRACMPCSVNVAMGRRSATSAGPVGTGLKELCGAVPGHVLAASCVFGVTALFAGMFPLTAPRAEAIWSRWSGAWEVTLDQQPDGKTCYWSTYDAPPPGHVRRLIFAANRRREVVVIASDRLEPLHRADLGSAGMLLLGGRLYAVEISAGIPLTDLPGGMLIGRLKGEDAARFARSFGQRADDEEVRLALPGGWSWRMTLRGAAAAAKDVAACMAEIEAQPGLR
jgi:hypothetical protein